ncbi:hypothetical protein, partial [Streptococcus sp. DD13]|uniref:hypothetical protein n=1 Tax=Streptococcus sp. DD13 TaxID=1777881 RepID=UPI0018D458EF
MKNKRIKAVLLSLALVLAFALPSLAVEAADKWVGDWSNLASDQKGGDNLAYVDYSSLTAEEQATIRQLGDKE